MVKPSELDTSMGIPGHKKDISTPAGRQRRIDVLEMTQALLRGPNLERCVSRVPANGHSYYNPDKIARFAEQLVQAVYDGPPREPDDPATAALHAGGTA